MAKSYRKSNLAIARNSRHNKSEDSLDSECPVELESDSDCGYRGGVDHYPSDDGEDTEEDWSDDESLAELEGDELEASLSVLRNEAEIHSVPSHFWQMMSQRDPKEWKKAEANRALGYNKNSTRTQERRRKEARGREAFKADAKTS